MERKVRAELYKMSAIMLVLVGLGIYARDFVIAGIEAKVALNSSIFAIFGLAAALAFRHVLALRNEIVALRALQVDYGARSRRQSDPLARPAVVFSEPELLGQGYRLITEELGRQDDLHLANSDVQALLHDVDQRINDRKSTILYFSGLMVFLGLLGAFMGLMKTVHAVSDLISSMDLSGNAGADSFGKMIEGMKAPLAGMSVGFSSSLFGLMTSMVLGALERCMTSALKTLRNEFEHWLSHITELESGHGESAGSGARAELAVVARVLESGAGHLREMRGAIDAANRLQEANHAAIRQLADATATLAATVAELNDPDRFMRPVAEAMGDLARHQVEVLGQFRGLYVEAQADRGHIRAMLDAIDARLTRSEMLDGAELHRQLDRIIAVQADMAERDPPPVIVLAGRERAGTVARVPRVLRALLGWMRIMLGDPIAARREARRLRREIRLAMAGTRRAVRQESLVVALRLDKIEATRKADRAALARMEAAQAAQLTRLDRIVPDDADTPATARFGDARAALERLRTSLDAIEEPDPAPRRPDAPTRRDGTHS